MDNQPKHTEHKIPQPLPTLYAVILHPDHGTELDRFVVGPADAHKTLYDFAKEFAQAKGCGLRYDDSHINTLGDFRVVFCNDPAKANSSVIAGENYWYVEDES